MDAGAYKTATSSPDAFSSTDVDATLRCLRTTGSPLSEALASASRQQIPMPPLHRDPSAVFFRLELTVQLVSAILSELLAAEAAAVSDDGFTTPEASQWADLVDKWARYKRWLDPSVG